MSIIMAVCVGLWVNIKSSDTETTSFVPDIYTGQNVRIGETYHVEQNDVIQTFEVIAIHWTGFFRIRVEPPEGHELDRDYALITGWTVAIPSSRLIEAQHLVAELPRDLQHAHQYN